VITAPLGRNVSAKLTAGVDHYTYALGQFQTTGVAVLLPITIAPGQQVRPARDKVTNTGVFAQMELGVHESFFLTGAVRADKNSYVGSGVDWPVSPRVGVAYTHDIGGTTVKLRGSYGEAIRSPMLGQREGGPATNAFVLPNPDLKPERQTGPDVGADLAFGQRGTLSVTYYDQRAKDLIQRAPIKLDTTPPLYQWQNLAVVKNDGWEFEGSLELGVVSLSGQFSIVHSAPKNLGAYTGTDFQVGQQFTDLPVHTAAFRVAANPFRRAGGAATMTYTGSRNSVDYLAYYGCRGGTAPCDNGTQPNGYVREVGAAATFGVSIDQTFSRMVTAFLNVEDLTNEGTKRSRANNMAVQGRITSIGFRLKY
jgi:outer membrane receptor protein involved in Fe transport